MSNQDAKTINDERKVDHLLLLVGGNPLPNVVAGKLLCKPNGKITLLHTVSTKDIASEIRNWFVKNDVASGQVKLSEIDRLDGRKIFKSIKNILAEGESSVGLHYTGGTAAMAVHTHAAVRERAHDPIFSYLDATTLCMRFDDGGSIYVGRPSELNLTIKDLFELQGAP